MATRAHCAYCFESLAASLEKRPALSLRDVEALWDKYNSEPTTTTELSEADAAYKPAAVSRLLAPSPGSASSSSLQSGGSSTPSSATSSSAATSNNSSGIFSKLTSGRGSKTSSAEADDEDDDDEEEEEDEAEDDEQQHPLFVTWNTLSRSSTDRRLRGCIGTFEPLSLSSGLSSYALTSAFDDTRFSPITSRELPTLECAVTLLTNFEPASSPMDWDIGVHGLRISFTDKGRRMGATYLPDVAKEQGWNKEEALVSLMRKAGWNGRADKWSDVSLNVTRYQGKKVALGFKEWKAWRSWVDEEIEDSR